MPDLGELPVRACAVGMGQAVVGPEEEPLLDDAVRRNVQGNVVPGFNKPHQRFLFLQVRAPRAARRWLDDLLPSITTMQEVLEFREQFRSRRSMPDRPSATWVNIAFSARGLAALAGEGVAAQLPEQSFHQGLAARSTYLGDPSSPAHPGHRERWVVGGPRNEADVLVIVAGDEAADRDAAAERILATTALDVVYDQPADALPGASHGHEHFGFRDGVSQPGIRGRLSESPGDFLTPRHVDPAAGLPAQLSGLPGQPLVWPGQFLLRHRRQDTEEVLCPADPPTHLPIWAAEGSYVVVRRLHQDVPAFRGFIEAAARATGLAPRHVAALLVGRWPSGAPVARAGTADDPGLGADRLANNHFLFDDDTRSLPLIDGVDEHPQARADPLGAVCPHFAHIRKVNPRDSGTDLGKPSDTLTRLILRRGITYGPPLPEGAPEDGRDRGLMFVGYAATIEDQFEFLVRRWSNSPIHPNHGGHDPLIGQRNTRGDRTRFVEMPALAGTVRLELARDWVLPTGGGYFFAPSLLALRTVLQGRPLMDLAGFGEGTIRGAR